MKDKDCVPAFPTENERQTGYSTYHYEGMSLRDWFAGKGLSGIGEDTMQAIWSIAEKDCRSTPALVAQYSYELADAMLKEREK